MGPLYVPLQPSKEEGCGGFQGAQKASDPLNGQTTQFLKKSF